jgi:hypothetical protein
MQALTSDTFVSTPVLLPNLPTETRLTRAVLEARVRPALYDSIEAWRRARASAGVKPADLHSVLLVGGSSRMPLVAQMIGAELGRPVAVDTHPKHAVALGAAWLAAGEAPAPISAPGDTSAGAPLAAAPLAAAPILAATGSVTAAAGVSGRTSQTAPDPARSEGNQAAKPRRQRLVAIGASVLALVLALAGAAYAVLGGDDINPANQTGGPPQQDERCSAAIKANERWACLTAATFDGSKLTIWGEVGLPAGTALNINGGYHLHLFGSDGANPAPSLMGTLATAPGTWYIDDELPSVAGWGDGRWEAIAAYAPAGQTLPAQVCVRIANDWHGLAKDVNGGYETGNCIPITQG